MACYEDGFGVRGAECRTCSESLVNKLLFLLSTGLLTQMYRLEREMGRVADWEEGCVECRVCSTVRRDGFL